MARIGLVTGFEPFAGLPSNPSERVLAHVGGFEASGFRVVARVLPVSFLRTPEAVAALLAEHDPAFVVSLGLAGGAPVPRVEMMALNASHAGVPDNDGIAPAGGVRVGEGPQARRATWDGPAVVEAIEAEGLPARLSFHAGGHLCNHTLYTVLGLLDGRSPAVPAGFLHLPHLPEEVVWMRAEAAAGRRPGPWEQPSMPLEAQVRAVRAAVQAVARQAAAG